MNIIFYLSDQQRYDTVNPEITPELCALASDGVFFENCYTCQPVCGPARACLQSGVYATATGCYRNGISLPRECTHIAEIFGAAGYDTAYIGKWHLASDDDFHCETTAIPRERHGGYSYCRSADILEFTSHGYDGYVFDENGNRIDFKGYRADCINDFVLEYIENHDSGRPFFMFVSQLEPHHQNDHGRFEAPEGAREKFEDFAVPSDLTAFEGDYGEFYPDYLGSINRLDQNIGRLVGKLKEKDIYDDTVIIYTSDHGCHFKTRNSEYKRSCHDSSLHIPLIIKGGGFEGGRRDGRLVSLIDFPPTLLSVAGIGVPPGFDGFAISPDGKKIRDRVFVQISESQVGRCVRTEDFKYSARSDGDGWNESASEDYRDDFLYDLRNDPDELENLVGDPSYECVKAELRAMLFEDIRKYEKR